MGIYENDTQLTTGEAARVVRVSQPTIIRWCTTGLVPFRRNPSGHRRIRYGDLIDAIEKATNEKDIRADDKTTD